MDIDLISLKEYFKKKHLPNKNNDDTSTQETDQEQISYTEEEWQEIKGIGPKLAQRLCEGGPFENLEDIKEIKGIKPKIFDNILEWHESKERQ